jgi:hypothetical protein
MLTLRKNLNLIYFADTYGVYRDDYMQKNFQCFFFSYIIGGLIMTIIARSSKPKVEETRSSPSFNTAASPTNDRDRALFGRLIGLNGRAG